MCCLRSVLKKLHFIHGEILDQQKIKDKTSMGLNQVSTSLSISSFLTLVWSGNRYFPTAQPPQVVIGLVSCSNTYWKKKLNYKNSIRFTYSIILNYIFIKFQDGLTFQV